MRPKVLPWGQVSGTDCLLQQILLLRLLFLVHPLLLLHLLLLHLLLLQQHLLALPFLGRSVTHSVNARAENVAPDIRR